jgi:hypothetical protein
MGMMGTWRPDGAQVIPDFRKDTLSDVVLNNVELGSVV